MIKILIVDDELLVRIGLKSTLNWEEYGYTLVGEAKNAKEAIELFDAYRPEILLTDINMPGMNGLELIRLLREKNPRLQSIILTHYEDFHYAREAVSLGARDYIVKSNLTSERLLKVLKETEKHIPGSYRQRRDCYPAEETIKFNTPDKNLASCLFGEAGNVPVTAYQADYIRSKLSLDGFQMALITFNLNMNENPQLDEKQRLVVEDVSRQVLSENPFPLIRTVHQNQIVYLFNYDTAEYPDGLGERISHFMNLLKINLKKFLNYYLLIGISSYSRELNDCSKLYYQAQDACKKAFFERNHISRYAEIPFPPCSEKKSVDWSILSGYIRDSRNQELIQYIEVFFEEVGRLKDFDYLKLNYESLIDMAGQNNSEHSLSDASLNKDHFFSLYDIEAVKMHIINIFNTIMESRESFSENSYIVRKSIDYINTHYSENISLNNLARNADVSRSYLSFLFKQELGVNFSHYLTKIRIGNAKKMLVETNLKIYEIAERVGFDSPYYFSKVFREASGITCKEYRNRHYGEV